MISLCAFPGRLWACARRSGLALSVAACLAAPSALPAADGKTAAATHLSATQIVEKHIAARGGLRVWRGLEALAVSGTMEAGTGDSLSRSLKVAASRRAPRHEVEARAAAPAEGKAGPATQIQLPFRMEVKRPDKSRIEIEFAGKTALQVYDGSHGWKLRPFLNRSDVEPFTPDEMKAESAKGPLDGPLVDYAAKGTRVEIERIEPVEGHDAYKLKLTLKSGRVQRIWIDTRSFLDVKVEGTPRSMDGRMHDVWVYQRDFRQVDGLMIPFVLETAVEGYPGTHKMLIEKVSINPKLDDSKFVKPHA